MPATPAAAVCSHFLHGWRFWSLEGEAQPAAEAAATEKPAKAKSSRAKKLIYRVPNQQGTPQGQQKFFCVACMGAFLVDAGTSPEVCPQGHRIDDPELTGTAGTPDAEAAEAAG